MKTIKKTTLIFSAILLFIYSCDTYEEDSIPNIPLFDIAINTTQGSQALVYTKAYFNEIYEKGMTFNLIKLPTNGTIDILENGEYFQYQPSEGSLSEEDNLSVEVLSSSGEKLGKAEIQINSPLGCGKGPVTTYVKTSNEESFILDLLDNDLFCDLQPDANGPFVLLDSAGNVMFGAVLDEIYEGDFNTLFSEATPGHLQYIPKEGFIGTEVLYYTLCVGSKVGNSFPDEFWLHPEWWDGYFTGKLEVEVTE